MQDFWQSMIDSIYTIWINPFFWLPTLIISLGIAYKSSEESRRKFQVHMGSELFHPLFFLFLAMLWLAIAATLVFGLIWTIWEVILVALPAPSEANDGKKAIWEYRLLLTKIASLAAVLGATVALPFTITKVKLSNEQNRHAEDVLFNDKYNTAINDLHAQRQVTIRNRSAMEDAWMTRDAKASKDLQDVWEDDIVRRNGAIDRLEKLAIERPEEAPRIARTLCIYLKQLTNDYPPEKPSDEMPLDELGNWASHLEVQRLDMQSAAQVLGRLSNLLSIPTKDLELDLADVNLQGMNLNGSDFSFTNFQGAYLDGTELNRSKLINTEFSNASLIGAEISHSSLHLTAAVNANFTHAWLVKTDASWAEFNNAIFYHAHLLKTSLIESDLTGVQFHFADLSLAQFSENKLTGTWFDHTKLDGAIFGSGIDLGQAVINSASVREVNLARITHLTNGLPKLFGDRSTILPPFINYPDEKWPNETLDDYSFSFEWELFKENPDAYIPPQHRND